MEKTATQSKTRLDFCDLPEDILISIFYTLNIEREKDKLLAISIIKILSERNKLELLINKSQSVK
ncbi:MAG: hypothetical protein CO129_07405 [Ignavibacteriales bacterium CG_4_9_14_3_um_filter_34_10]|nr:MAG: hypothetical protein CO129_07405 [Ignavibacteriales bacterium CG_4_9_14_3_um_filter_34_10]